MLCWQWETRGHTVCVNLIIASIQYSKFHRVTSLFILEQHSNQTVRFEGQVYSLCQI